MGVPAPSLARGAKERALVPALILGSVLIPLNSTMILVGLPEVVAGLHTTVAMVTWVITIYLILMAVMQPLAGKMGDLYGHRRVLLTGLALFLVGSVLAANSASLWELVAWRAIQALGGALTAPSAMALTRRVFSGDRLARVLGVMSAGQGLGAALGPLIGAWLIGQFGWPAIFWVNIPLIAVAGGLGLWCLPAAPPTDGRPLDVGGGILLAIFLTALMLAVPRAGSSLEGLAVLAVPAAVLLVWRERRAPEPLLRLNLFGLGGFRAATGGIFTQNFLMYSTLLVMPIYLKGLGEPLAVSGLALFLFSLAGSGASWAGGRLALRLGRKVTVSLAFAIMGAVFLVLAEAWRGLPVPLLLALLTVAGIGSGLGSVSFQATALESAPRRDAGMTWGMYATSRYLGSILASAVLGLLVPTPVLYFVVLAVVAGAGLGVGQGFSGTSLPPAAGVAG